MSTRRLAILSLMPMAAGCGPGDAKVAGKPSRFPIAGTTVLTTVDGTAIVTGGFGSAIAATRDTGLFLALTDRGPNYHVAEDTKAFPVPAFSPRVGWFRRGDSTLVPVRIVELTNADGSPITGLPNPLGRGGTGEIAVTVEGTLLTPDSTGLDPEGIHPLNDGSFWVTDEYGPHWVHFDSTGRALERISPFSSGDRSLPAVLSKRRPNRGMEGLTGNGDGTMLVGLMQSPLDNPRAAGRASIHARIVVYAPATGQSRQYLYPLDSSSFFTSDIVLLRERRSWSSSTTVLPLAPRRPRPRKRFTGSTSPTRPM